MFVEGRRGRCLGRSTGHWWVASRMGCHVLHPPSMILILVCPAWLDFYIVSIPLTKTKTCDFLEWCVCKPTRSSCTVSVNGAARGAASVEDLRENRNVFLSKISKFRIIGFSKSQNVRLLSFRASKIVVLHYLKMYTFYNQKCISKYPSIQNTLFTVHRYTSKHHSYHFIRLSEPYCDFRGMRNVAYSLSCWAHWRSVACTKTYSYSPKKHGNKLDWPLLLLHVLQSTEA